MLSRMMYTPTTFAALPLILGSMGERYLLNAAESARIVDRFPSLHQGVGARYDAD